MMSSTIITARIWLAAGAALLGAVLVLHGPPDPDLSAQLHHIAEGGARWAFVHWIAAISLFLISGAAFLTLIGTSGNDRPGAWMVMALGALTTFTTAVAEATAVFGAAHAGNQVAFDAWWVFSSGMANGFFALAIATALIAMGEMLSETARVPGWASRIGTMAGLASAVGWSLGQQMGVWIGGPIWLISTMVMCAWLVWFGVASAVPAGSAVRSTA